MEGPVDRDARQLQALGYAQQLLRDMGGFSNFALSFSIISILTGAVTLYGYGLRMGGPLEMALGWPLVSLLTLPVAASLAQLASSYPPPARSISGLRSSAAAGRAFSPPGSTPSGSSPSPPAST